MTNSEQIEMAQTIARALGVPEPRWAYEVENLTGMVYYGPDPVGIGVTQYPVVQRNYSFDGR